MQDFPKIMKRNTTHKQVQCHSQLRSEMVSLPPLFVKWKVKWNYTSTQVTKRFLFGNQLRKIWISSTGIIPISTKILIFLGSLWRNLVCIYRTPHALLRSSVHTHAQLPNSQRKWTWCRPNSGPLKIPFNCSLTVTPLLGHTHTLLLRIEHPHQNHGRPLGKHKFSACQQQCFNLGFMFIISDCELVFFFLFGFFSNVLYLWRWFRFTFAIFSEHRISVMGFIL